jgi:lipopolysaccharide export system permease protein
MPLLWRYLIKNFFKLFVLCIGSFLCILIVLRAQNIAKFAAFQGNLYSTVLFTVLQLPYILPFAIALSALLSSFLSVKKLSETGTLTCMRSCGLSLTKIFFPLLCLSLWFGCINFLLISEICPFCKKKTKELLNTCLQNNPLSLLDDNSFIRSRHILSLTNSISPCHKKNLTLAFSTSATGALSLILANDLSYNQGFIEANRIHIFSLSKDSSGKKTLIESYNFLKSTSASLLPSYRKYHHTFTFEELSTKKCLIKLQKVDGKERKHGIFEILKRLFFLSTPISFIFLGIATSVSVSRENKTSLSLLIASSLVILSSYFFGKSFESRPVIASLVFFAPQLLVSYLGNRRLKKIEQGIS